MIDVVPLEASDVRHVLDHPWEVSEAELAAFGLIASESWRVIEQLWIRSDYAYALRNYEETVAIMGGHVTNDDQYRTWFLAADSFPKLGRDVTRAVRRCLRDVKKAAPGIRVVATTGSDRADSESWFRLLGFARAEEYDYATHNGRVFKGYELRR